MPRIPQTSPCGSHGDPMGTEVANQAESPLRIIRDQHCLMFGLQLVKPQSSGFGKSNS
jgi:hypothetical protein